MKLGLEGRRALVTGGSKGLGAAIARELVGEGVRVAICARNEAEVMATAEELRSGDAVVYAQAVDVTDPEQVRDFVARSAEELGGIDFLVNNAGGAHPGNFATLTDEDWIADLDVKLFSLIRCSREVLPHMRAAGGGRIVNIGAVYSRYPDPTFFATSVNRAAGNSFTKTLAIEVAKDNILVNAVNIGFVTTPQWDNIHQRRAPELPRDEFLDTIAAQEVPLGRFGRPDEVSGLVAFLLSDPRELHHGSVDRRGRRDGQIRLVDGGVRKQLLEGYVSASPDLRHGIRTRSAPASQPRPSGESITLGACLHGTMSTLSN